MSPRSCRDTEMAIHEKSLIRPENLKVQDKLVLDGVDVSGHWKIGRAHV